MNRAEAVTGHMIAAACWFLGCFVVGGAILYHADTVEPPALPIGPPAPIVVRSIVIDGYAMECQIAGNPTIILREGRARVEVSCPWELSYSFAPAQE